MKPSGPGIPELRPFRGSPTERDVKGGRSHLNFSEWNKPQRPVHELADQIRAGRMPPWFYRPMHPESKLTPEEKTALIDGLQRSLDGDQK
jgi:hypothetical protein